LSLTSLYKLKHAKNSQNDENQTSPTEEAETLKAKLEKIAITPDIAKRWQANPCGQPC